MIAMSDAVILLVSASVLGSGIYRWQENVASANLTSQNNIRVESTVVTSNYVPTPSSSMASSAQENPAVRSQGTLMGKPVNAASSNDQNIVVMPPQTNNGQADAASAASAQPPQRALYGVHVVESGDSLSMLSERFGTTVRELQSINGVDGTLINIGQKLHYPLPAN